MNSLFKTVTGDRPENHKEVVTFPQKDGNKEMIFIDDLEIVMSIGVGDDEKKNHQRVIVSMDIETDYISANSKDDISNVVSYTDIIAMIEEIAAEQHIDLVETFANKIIDASFAKDNRIKSIIVSVRKPDIVKNAASVGCKIQRAK